MYTLYSFEIFIFHRVHGCFINVASGSITKSNITESANSKQQQQNK